jgi:hypothetical protein
MKQEDLKVGMKFQNKFGDIYTISSVSNQIVIVKLNDKREFKPNQLFFQDILNGAITQLNDDKFESINSEQTIITCSCTSKVLFSKGCQCGAFFKEQSIKGVL